MMSKKEATALEVALRYKTSEEHNTMLFWNGPLSQWWYSPFEIDGVIYNCAEQWMMAKKADIFGDTIILERIMAATGPYTDRREWIEYPREQKKLGRQVKGFNSQIWNAVARPIVLQGSLAKFSQSPALLAALMHSDGYTLVEASPFDVVWGIGMDDKSPEAFNPSQWQGTNWLGEVLTLTRQYLTE